MQQKDHVKKEVVDLVRKVHIF